MNKLIDWLQTSFSPKMNRIVQNPWILTIKNSVLQALPLIFLGSIFSLLTIPQNYFEWWPNFWTPYGWTFGIVSLIVAFLIPYNLLILKEHKRSAVNAGIAGVILFLISLNPQFVADQAAMIAAGESTWFRISNIGGFGAGGMFLAIVAGLISAAVLNKFADFSFFKEDSVIPDFVKDWFNSMLPIGIVTVFGWILTDPKFLNLNLYQLVVSCFMPLQSIVNTPVGLVIAMFLFCSCILWAFLLGFLLQYLLQFFLQMPRQMAFLQPLVAQRHQILQYLLMHLFTRGISGLAALVVPYHLFF